MLSAPKAISPIDQAIEGLCNEGCKAVHQYIEQIQQNSPIELLEGMSDSEKEIVLQELQSIMSVYTHCK